MLVLLSTTSTFVGCNCVSEPTQADPAEDSGKTDTDSAIETDTDTDGDADDDSSDGSTSETGDSETSGTDTGTDTSGGDSDSSDDGDTSDDDPAVSQVVAGEDFTCALIDDGRVRCWGRLSQGANGYGDGQTIGDDELPFEAGDVPLTEDDDPAVELAAGPWHVCARLESGAVQCWGTNELGQTGHGTGANPVGDDETPASLGPVSIGGLAIQISAGQTSSCALFDDGTVRCWGHGALLQNGSIEPIGDDELASTAPLIDMNMDIVQADTAGHYGCFLGSGGNVRCFGIAGGSGQSAGGLGYGNTDDIVDPLAAPDVSIGGSATSVRLGRFHSCVTLEGGDARCWGSNYWGELGLGRANDQHVGDDELPSDVPTLDFDEPIVGVAASDNFTCAVSDSGNAWCWGLNQRGQLGQGHTENLGLDTSSAPTVADIDPISLPGPGASIAAGARHACALLEDASVVCWGDGTFGALGYGNADWIGDDEPADAGGPVQVLD